MKLVTAHEINLMTDTEGLVLQGCGGNLADWVSGINELLTEEGILLDGDIFKDIYLFEQDKATNILFCMDGVKLDVAKLAIWRIVNHDKFGGTWLSDYIPNRLQAVKPEPIVKKGDNPTVSTRPEPLLKVENTDLTVLLAKIHAIAGKYAADIIHNLNTLESKRSAEYLMLISDDKIFLTEAAHAYRHGTTAFDNIQTVVETPATKAFALHVTDMHKEHVVGDIVELNLRELQLDILRHSIYPIRIDAMSKVGAEISFTPEEWENQEPLDRDHLRNWTKKFDPADNQAVIRHLEKISGNHAQSGRVVAPDELLNELNTATPKLYDLTMLQREANRLFGYTAQQTLDYTQSLYEKKLCTYPRTDSRFLTEDMAQGIPSLVSILSKKLSFLPVGIELSVITLHVIDNSKVSDHHAIIPTPSMANANLDGLPAGERNILYMLAVRLLCAVGEKHSYAETVVTVECEGHNFSANGRAVLQNGWKEIENAFKACLKNKSKDEDTDGSALPELSDGQVFSSVSAFIREGFSSPPKHFTEDLLLAAMENAGVDDMPEDVERKGLGTPATRAGVIEKLVKSGLIERKKRQMFPTKKGKTLIAVLPDEIKSPLLTAEWEHRLGQVERGEISDLAFMDGIATMTRELVSSHTVPNEAHKELFARPVGGSVGVCPRCSSAVTEAKRGFFCSSSGCKFALWKDNRFFAAKKKEITRPIAATLLKEGRIFIKGLYSEKTGKIYDATVVLVDTGQHVNFKLEFDNKNK